MRSRRQLIGGSIGDERSPSQAAMCAQLAADGLGAAAQVATFSLRGPERSKVQLRIHAGIGNDYAASKVVSLGNNIVDREGRIMETLGARASLSARKGRALGARVHHRRELPPGEYT